MTKDALSYWSGWIFVAAFVPIIISILKGYKPARSSWIIWPSLDTLLFLAMRDAGSVNSQIKGAMLGGWIVCAFALWFGESGWKRKQLWYLALGVVGVILCVFLGQTTAGILVFSITIVVGGFETLEDAWKNPDAQLGLLTKLAWLMFLVSCIIQLVAVKKWDIDTAAQPISFFVIDLAVAYLVLIRAPLVAVKKGRALDEFWDSLDVVRM